MIFNFSFPSPLEKDKIFVLLNDGNYFLNQALSRNLAIRLREGQNIVEIRKLKQVNY
jgi:hypothetical protein